MNRFRMVGIANFIFVILGVVLINWLQYRAPEILEANGDIFGLLAIAALISIAILIYLSAIFILAFVVLLWAKGNKKNELIGAAKIQLVLVFVVLVFVLIDLYM